MSLEEHDDIQSTARFRVIEGMMEGKWFADTREGVLLHAANLYPDGEYRLVAASIPESMLKRLHRQSNLDRCGPATYLELNDLALIVPILEVEPL